MQVYLQIAEVLAFIWSRRCVITEADPVALTTDIKIYPVGSIDAAVMNDLHRVPAGHPVI